MHRETREAVRQHAARQEVSELLLHECGERGTVRVTPDRLEEGVEVLVDHAVPDAVLGVAWPVVAGVDRHSGDIGAPGECQECPKIDTPQRWANRGHDR